MYELLAGYFRQDPRLTVAHRRTGRRQPVLSTATILSRSPGGPNPPDDHDQETTMKTTILAALLAACAMAHAADATPVPISAASSASAVEAAAAARRAADAAKVGEAAQLIRSRQPQAAIDRVRTR